MALAALVTPTDGAYALVPLGTEVTYFTPQNVLGTVIAVVFILLLNLLVKRCCFSYGRDDPPVQIAMPVPPAQDIPRPSNFWVMEATRLQEENHRLSNLIRELSTENDRLVKRARVDRSSSSSSATPKESVATQSPVTYKRKWQKP
eukprot:11042755-Alexandrium_andersonii.AAC.1